MVVETSLFTYLNTKNGGVSSGTGYIFPLKCIKISGNVEDSELGEEGNEEIEMENGKDHEISQERNILILGKTGAGKHPLQMLFLVAVCFVSELQSKAPRQYNCC